MIMRLGFTITRSRYFIRIFPFNLRLVGWQHQSSFTRCLDIRLVIASNAIANRNKVKLLRVENVAVLFRKLNQSFRQHVVKLLLLDSIVARRELQVVVSIINQEAFQLREKGNMNKSDSH